MGKNQKIVQILIFSCWAFQVSHLALAFQFFEPRGARVGGMGFVGSAVYMSDSYMLNPAAIASEKRLAVHFNHDRRFFISGFDRSSLWGHTPVKSFVVGGHVFQFGDRLYNELQMGATVAHNIKTVSLGLRAEYQQVHAESYGNSGALVIHAGGIAALTKHIFFGGVVSNITQSRILRESDINLPTVLTAALAWQLNSKLWVMGELEKDIRYAERVKAGLEYQVQKYVSIRTGFNSNPNVAYFGLGCTTQNIALHYAAAVGFPFGTTHMVQISYFFHKKQK